MTITINGRVFQGPFNDVGYLKNESGVYVVLDEDNKIVDVGESENVKNRLQDHERSNCWEEKADEFSFAAYYTDKTSRMRIEKEIRDYHNLPCGKR